MRRNLPLPLTPEEVTVKLDYSFFEQGSMSRSAELSYQTFYDNYIKTNVLAPETYNLTFSQSSSAVQKINGRWDSADGIKLLEGTYLVNGISRPADYYFSNKMFLSFSEDVTVTKETQSIILKAHYDCFLLMFDSSSIKTIKAKFESNSGGTDLSKLGNEYYIFVNAKTNKEGRALEILITRTNGSTVELALAKMPFENGKYYFFNDISNSFDIDPMENGN